MRKRAPPAANPVALPANPGADLRLVPISRGHVACGASPPRVRDDVIETFLPDVNACYRWSAANIRESGFLSYLREEGGVVAEDLAYGRRYDISWHWRHRDSMVAASFHTHPNARSEPTPSGIDLLGAIVRGDHLHYILTMDGRLVGWRFRDPAGHARHIDEALRALSDQRALTRGFLRFAEEALEALAPQVAVPVYGARLRLLDDGGIHLERAAPADLLGGVAPA